MKEAEEEKTRRWQRPRQEAVAVARRDKERTREEGALQGAVLCSFAKSTKTNEQKKVRFVVPPEVPHDARISIEDLVYTDIDESDVDELRDE